jgi:hypothetical protein
VRVVAVFCSEPGLRQPSQPVVKDVELGGSGGLATVIRCSPRISKKSIPQYWRGFRSQNAWKSAWILGGEIQVCQLETFARS